METGVVCSAKVVKKLVTLNVRTHSFCEIVSISFKKGKRTIFTLFIVVFIQKKWTPENLIDHFVKKRHRMRQFEEIEGINVRCVTFSLVL